MQRKYCSDDYRSEHPQYRQYAQENWWGTARLVFTVPRCELMAQKIDPLVIAHLIEA